jgi:Protein of unknown function DUF262
MELHQQRIYTVNDFLSWARRDELLLQPKFQRRLVWHKKAKSFLIDTVVRSFPIPPVYMREVLEIAKRKTVREVVDGQQRLQAILDFLDDELTVSRVHNEEIGGTRFSELSEALKRQILNYPFSVVLLVGATDADVFRTFARINSYTLPLNAQEKLNAKYFGAFKQFVFKLGQEHLEFWRTNSILSDRNIVRMGEAELTSELVVAMLDGLQDKKKILESFYKGFDDAFPQANRIRREFQNCIEKIDSIAGSRLNALEFHKKALFYSLFCAIYDLLYGMPRGLGVRLKIPTGSHPSIRRALSRLSEELRAETPSRKYLRLIEASARQTDNLNPRKIRHRYILETIVDAVG